MADGRRVRPRPTEVDVFDQAVRRDDVDFPASGFDEGGIVADAERNPARMTTDPTFEAFDEGVLADRGDRRSRSVGHPWPD